MRTLDEIGNTAWFGTVPDGWSMVPLKSLFSVRKGITVTKADLTQAGVPVISYGQIHSKSNNGLGITPELVRFVPDTFPPDNSPVSRAGSFLFASTSEDLAGCGACIYNDGAMDVYSGGDTNLLVPKEGGDSRYLAYLFQTDAWRWQIRRDLVDVKVFHVNKGNLNETYIVLPPRSTQRRITSYLDKHCQSIDNDIAQRVDVIAKLHEYQKAVISTSVIKGLNSNVETKNTGRDWLGEIPATWKTCRLKLLCETIFDGPFGSHLKSKDYVDNGIRVVRLENLRYMRFDDNKRSYVTPMKYETIKRHTVTQRDLIMATFIGKEAQVASLPESVEFAVNKADCIGIRPRLDVIDKRFLQYALSSESTLGFLRLHMHGATRDRVNTTQIKDIEIVLPSLREQREIASFLDNRCTKVAEAIDREEQIIGKLEEYRKSLIYHAVTGKIDCSREVGNG